MEIRAGVANEGPVIYAVKKEMNEEMIEYNTCLIDAYSGKTIDNVLVHSAPLASKLGAADLVINRSTNHIIFDFNDKSYIVQDLMDLQRFKRMELSFGKSRISSCTCSNDKFYSIVS